MLRLLRAFGVLCVAMGLVFAAPSSISSNPDAPAQVRIIRMDPVEPASGTFCSGDPSGRSCTGTVTFHTYGQMYPPAARVDISQLGYAGDAWALYIVEGSIEEGAILARWVFNAYPYGSAAADVAFWASPPSEFPLDAPTLTAFVAYEADDGRMFDPSLDMAVVVLAGTSTR